LNLFYVQALTEPCFWNY